ncbi:hypothetical protein, partial [Parasedimentitalea maritima]|uniref:hypothetical protein n=1 Tax=Parasedimentitalea maritima TaxID=2578117 RepID=UPI001ADA6C02
KAYLELAQDALETPNVDLDRVAPSVPKEVAQAKPRLVAHKQDDGLWLGVASINGVEVARCPGMPSRIEAMQAAYKAAGGR